MSADGYSKCPKCGNENAVNIAIRQAAVEKARDILTGQEFGQWLLANPTPKGESSTSVREYYEIGILEDTGEFFVDYEGECDICGFEFSFHHKEKLS